MMEMSASATPALSKESRMSTRGTESNAVVISKERTMPPVYGSDVLPLRRAKTL